MKKPLRPLAGFETALIIIGWFTFVSAFLFPDFLVTTIILQTVARVLP